MYFIILLLPHLDHILVLSPKDGPLVFGAE